MELQQLRHFVAVMEHKTMHAASRALGLSQPALTRSIQALERLLEVPLFDREARRSQPTPAGMEFFHHAKAILSGSQHAREDAIRIHRTRSGEVRLGIGGTFATFLINTAIMEISTRFPDLRLRVHEGHYESLIELLLAGSLDVAFGNLPTVKFSAEVAFEPLVDLHGSPYVRTQHPLVRKRKLTLADTLEHRWLLVDQVHARSHFEQMFGQAKLPLPKQVVWTNSVTLIKTLVQRADFITCIHDDFFQRERHADAVKALAIPEFHYDRKAGLFYRPAVYQSPAVLQVMETIRDICRRSH